MAKVVVIPYKPRDCFKPFHERTQRWSIIVAHRRAGKTVACINDLIRRAVDDGKADGRYAYIAPYYSQAKSVAWDYLLHYSAPIRKQANASELWVELVTGARIRLFGADNAEALRGLYLDGVIADEYADWKPSVWGAILRPALSDRQGWAVFIGTPKGPNAFKSLWDDSGAEWLKLMLKASETGLIDPGELADAKGQMTQDQYEQEYECSFSAAVVGAIYAQEMGNVDADGRITSVPHDPTLQVSTYWDLGIDDATCIWFVQQVGREVRAIDYYEASGEGLPHYARVLQDKGYLYARHVAPHDIQVREIGSGRSRIETAASLGISFEVCPQLSVEDGIHALKMLLPRMWFDKDKCRAGIEALQNYRRELNQRLSDDKRQVFKPTPVHDWASHAADAGRYMAVALRDPEKRPPQGTYNIGWMG